ncbi:MAG TPA: hypothetical protein PLW83_01275, partial [Deltaproteobacteria bacterium]|nr:hypothetical protein [Deltaproteobacteria bacterium]
MKLIEKTAILGVLERWSREYNVLGPSLKPNGDCVFDTFDPSSFTMEYRKPPMPPKCMFFPQYETIFHVSSGSFEPVVRHEKTMLFGIRACDLMGIRQSRSFFTRDF